MKKLSLLSVLLVLLIMLSGCADNASPDVTSTTELSVVTEEVLTEEIVEPSEPTTTEPTTTEPTTIVTTTRVPETDKIENVTTKPYSINWWGKVNKAKFEVESDIRYSANGGASYGNQTKEFPSDKECYVRIQSKAISNGAGKDDIVYVTYKFTGTDKYSVKLSEGMAKRIQCEEDNTIVYIQELVADKEKNAEENIVIFQLTPFGEGSARVNISYGDNVEERYDKNSEIYFRND